MSEIFARKGGRILSNSVTHGAIANYTYTVPRGKKWLILGLYVERDVNAALDLAFRDINNEILFEITQIAAGVTNLYIPRDLPQLDEREYFYGKLLNLGGAYDVLITWGVAQATPITRLWVWES